MKIFQVPRPLPPDSIFSRYTRYAATTRINIEDFWARSRYMEPLQALQQAIAEWMVDGLSGGVQ